MGREGRTMQYSGPCTSCLHILIVSNNSWKANRGEGGMEGAMRAVLIMYPGKCVFT